MADSEPPPTSIPRIFGDAAAAATTTVDPSTTPLLRTSPPFASCPSSPLFDSDDIPTNVCTKEQLAQLPEACRSDRYPHRPLVHYDATTGEPSYYSLRPLAYAAANVLVVETMERLAFYGVNYTQASYLTGVYNEDWNANMDAIPASTYVAVSVAVAYSTPFVGVWLEKRIGDYKAIGVGAVCLYLPGLVLIALTTIPMGSEFHTTMLSIGLLGLWPTGTGIVKSLVNVFGARQFHPLLQSSLIEAYFVKFYMVRTSDYMSSCLNCSTVFCYNRQCINIGALIGGIIVPILAQTNITMAYFVPVIMLTIGVIAFLSATPRYVRSAPTTKAFLPPDGEKSDSVPLSVIFRVCLLVVPFNIAYSQMATTFIVQGTVMEKACGWIDAASMNNADAVAVLLFGYLVGTGLYPWCSRNGIKIPTTYKFAIGSFLGAAAIGWALLVEHWIFQRYQETGEKLSILWQAVSYILIGCGEIFAVSAAYEVAFTAAPPDYKVVASAVNLFCIGGVPNFVCVGLYRACHGWFRNARGTATISRIEDYVTARVDKYFWLLGGIALTGVIVNTLPPVRDFVAAMEDKAAYLLRTPKATPSRAARRADNNDVEVSIDRHQYYLKYGSGPSLLKLGSMRAAIREQAERKLKLKRHVVSRMYSQKDVLMPMNVLRPGGPSKPVQPTHRRSNSR